MSGTNKSMKALGSTIKSSYGDQAIANMQKETEALRQKKELEHSQALLQQQMTADAIAVEAAAQQSKNTETPPAQGESKADSIETKPEESKNTSVNENGLTQRNSRQMKEKNSAIAFIQDQAVVFNEAFQVKHAKRPDFKPFSFSAPADIALEVKTKAARDGLNLCELNNLLLVWYFEKGLPKELMERYKKSTKVD